ncbi:RecX family transcriptional regulator [Candidatus Saccharibacteria bacterium]|nr:RecX family transcriptional regulator [Candidatus Saccharibacteria bacterium]
MEIYKLSDDIPASRAENRKKTRRLLDVVEDTTELRITDVKQGVRNENRVNVYVGGKYAFSLDIAQVVELGVKVGRVVTAEELADLKRASEFGKMYQRALEWVLVRPRSTRELRDYLLRKLKQSSPEDLSGFSQEIIDRLVERGYVDDRRFAEFWVENRFVKKGVSEKRLRMELMKKGISRDTIDAVLRAGVRDEAEEIRKIIRRKRNKYDDIKLTQYLCRQGFPYELVRELVAQSSGMD